MDISVIAENSALNTSFTSEHGLSIYIENGAHKYLVDMGASDAFIKNALTLNIDLSKVDTAIVSHGHADHGGGLGHFLNINDKAHVYLSRRDSGFVFIGLDRRLLPNSRFIYTEGKQILNEDAFLFSGVECKYPLSSCNNNLYMHDDGIFVHDKFRHEQNLAIKTEDGKLVLFVGCAHNGVLNIMYKLKIITGLWPNIVVGGMHLSANGGKIIEDSHKISNLAQDLLATGAKFYTCHCTGKTAFMELKKVLGDKIEYINAGSKISF